MDIEDIKNTVIHGNNLDVLPTLPDNSVDAIVTDPPYGLSFMGKKRDYDVPSQKLWEECLRVLKPGGYLLAFAGTRTQHRMAVRIEDAGFEIRDMIAWVYGSGFPKSLNIGKAIQRHEGVELEDSGVVSSVSRPNVAEDLYKSGKVGKTFTLKNVTTDNAKQWEGWGTALKPALEPITVARKPLDKGLTVAENCLKWGVGGINIDESRVGTEVITQNQYDRTPEHGNQYGNGAERKQNGIQTQTVGRFPANLIHDGSDEVVELFPNSKGTSTGGNATPKQVGSSIPLGGVRSTVFHNDSGSASRFFYCAKASKSERNRGCEELEKKENAGSYEFRTDGSLDGKPTEPKSNFHPTVKPIALMEYLVKLVSKEGAIVLDPFAGSGSTLVACKNISRNYIGMEMTEEYIPIIEARLNAVVEEEPEEDIQPSLF